MHRRRRLGLGLGSLALLTATSCAPAPQEPTVRGPEHEPAVSSAPLLTRELVWVTARRILRIRRGSNLCRKDDGHWTRAGGGGEACVRLSRTDRDELDRFFGNEAFRQRWVAFGGCPARRVFSSDEAFMVTYADGERIGKELDAPVGSPITRRCDRATRDAISTIGDDLARRYFR